MRELSKLCSLVLHLRRPPNAFLCNSQTKICTYVKSFTHVHKTPIHSLSWECCHKAFSCLIARCPTPMQSGRRDLERVMNIYELCDKHRERHRLRICVGRGMIQLTGSCRYDPACRCSPAITGALLVKQNRSHRYSNNRKMAARK